MPRPQRPVDPAAGPVQRFAADLRALRERSGCTGYRVLAARAHFSATTLSEAAAGRRLPTLAVTLAYVQACGGDLVEWERRWRALSAGPAGRHPPGGGDAGESGGPADEQAAPYRGLAPYRTADARWFFGREMLVEDLVSRLEHRRFLAVFGPSGVGKSSLLHAGLLPEWVDRGPTVVMVPGTDPMAELAVHLARWAGVSAGALLDELRADPARAGLTARQALAGDGSAQLLVVVDQFEEIFTGPRPAQEAFVAALCGMSRPAGSRVRVVLGIRADAYPRCAEVPDLVAALSDNQLLVGAMSPAELRQAVRRPAELAGLMVEGALVSTVVAELTGRPGALPLASHALLEAWRRRRGAAVTLAGYEATGGVAGAVSRTAEHCYAALDDAQHGIARRLLLRLLQVTEDGEIIRRRMLRDELDTDDPDAALVLSRLTAARLLTTTGDTVEIAHEALIRAWPRLRDWAAEDRDGLRVQHELTRSAAAWEAHRRDPEALYRGRRLDEAVAWSARRPGILSGAERRFLDSSLAGSRRAAAARRRRALGALAGVLTVIGVLVATALVRGSEAQAQSQLALSRRLAADARTLAAGQPELALLLARRAMDAGHTPEADTALRQATLTSRVRASRDLGFRVYSVAASPDGEWVAAAGDYPGVQVVVWNWARGGEPVALGDTGRGVLAMAFDADGRRLAGIGYNGSIRMWQLSDPDHPTVVTDDAATVRGLAFGPDGRLAGAGADGTVRVWDPARPGPPTAVLRGHRGAVWQAAFSPDGGRIASAGDDGTIRVRPLRAGTGPGTTTRLAGPVGTVAFRGGRAVGSRADGQCLWSAFVVHTPCAVHRALSPDGRRLATAAGDGAIRISAPDGTAELARLRGHTEPIEGLAFRADARLLVSGDRGGTVKVWDTGGLLDPVELPGHHGPVRDAVFLPSGGGVLSGGVLSGGVLSGGDDGTVRLSAVDGATPSRVLRRHRGSVRAVAVSADGRWAASTGADGATARWPLDDPAEAIVGRQATGAFDVALAPDGSWAVDAGTDGMVRRWAAASGPPTLYGGHDEAVRAVAVSADGSRIAGGSDDGTIRVQESGTGREVFAVMGHHGGVTGLAFAPGAGNLATTGGDGLLRLWSPSGAQLRAAPSDGARSIGFAPDGRSIIGVDAAGAVRIWRTDGAGEPIVLAAGGDVTSAAFDGDGRRIVTAHRDGGVRVWPCEVCGPLDTVRALAEQHLTRRLTAQERRAFG